MKGRQPICTDYYNCSLPKEQRDIKHMRLYHDPDPVKIRNTVAGGPPITINRDPNKGMYYPCDHPACDHISILRTAPGQHQKFCRFINPLKNRPQRARANKQGRGRRTHRYSQVQTDGRSDSTFSDLSDDGSYSSSSSLGSKSGKESGRDSEHHDPREYTSALILEQSLEGVSKLNNSMNRLTEQVEEIQEQTDHNEEQVEKLVVNSTSLDMHTESLRIEMDLIGEYLGDLLQENRGIKNQLKGIKLGLGGGGLAARDPHRQTMTPPKEQQQEHAAAHGQGARPTKE